MAQRTRTELRWEPMLLGGVFAAGGTPQNLSETLSPAKSKHNLLDMQRWAHRFGVPLIMLRARVHEDTPLRVFHNSETLVYWISDAFFVATAAVQFTEPVQ